ncbi:MAG: nucleotide exchange factor GrpE [Phycisphaerales bacterium]|nr:nucleotide exchange factor GrpE [Phycisphaerales bacterium]
MAQEDQDQQPPIDDEELASETAESQIDAALRQENAELKARLIRWQADFQNLQRTAAREILDARQNANADFAKSLLTVLDHFDMALSVDPAKVDAKSVLDGVKITYDELRKVLANRGIESFDPTNQPFDPHQHEAVLHEPSDQHDPMTVTQTFQPGYKIADRILRHAKVKVSK